MRGQHFDEFELLHPTSHIFIEVQVQSFNAAQMELILSRCCQESGDTLLAKDPIDDGESIRYLVHLATEEDQRIHIHVQTLTSALKHGLLAFTFLYISLLVEVIWSDQYCENEILTFPFKEQRSEVYTAIHQPHTIYITRPHHDVLDDDQVQWLVKRSTYCRIL